MHKPRADVEGLAVGIIGLALTGAYEIADAIWPWVPGARVEVEIALLVAFAVVTICCAFVRYSVAPVREAFLHGWHARAEEEEKLRTRGQDGAKLYRIPSSAYGSDLAAAAPGAPAQRGGHHPAGRHLGPLD